MFRSSILTVTTVPESLIFQISNMILRGGNFHLRNVSIRRRGSECSESASGSASGQSCQFRKGSRKKVHRSVMVAHILQRKR